MESYSAMINIPLIRCLNQQLISPQFTKPEEVVSWMGMIQAQDFGAAKMAVAMRMKCSSIEKALKKVDKALDEGRIIRIHVSRPTWQLVAAEDVRWMCDLSRERNARAFAGYCKQAGVEITPEEYASSFSLIENALKCGHSLTAQELKAVFAAEGLNTDRMHLTGYIWMAENRGLICSGKLDGNRSTYALLDERVPDNGPSYSRKEAVIELMTRYFKSHSPAKMPDFYWWAGLHPCEASDALPAIYDDLENELLGLVHKDCRRHGKLKGVRRLLPAFDEYLVGYTDRSDVLPDKYKRRCITANGLFFPTIMEEGKIVGTVRKGVEKYFEKKAER